VVKEYTGSEAALKTFLREARLLVRLRHPAIVTILSVFQYTHQNKCIFCVEMPLYHHRQLDQWVAKEQPCMDNICSAFSHVLGALQHLHAHAVVHRDVKPANILIDAAGRPHLADFDISVETAERTTVRNWANTTLLSLAGTTGFMAPAELGVVPASPAFVKTLEAVCRKGKHKAPTIRQTNVLCC
jgi:serine/threonine protein kinase